MADRWLAESGSPKVRAATAVFSPPLDLECRRAPTTIPMRCPYVPPLEYQHSLSHFLLGHPVIKSRYERAGLCEYPELHEPHALSQVYPRKGGTFVYLSVFTPQKGPPPFWKALHDMKTMVLVLFFAVLLCHAKTQTLKLIC